MTETAHPFVVARNRTLDWRALLAPEELIASNEDYGLVLQTGKEHPAPVTVQPWEDHSARSWVLCYRSVSAQPAFVGQGGSGPLTDKFGRELFVVEGVALSGSVEPSQDRAQELIDRVHDDAVAAFRAFWSETDEGYMPSASAPLASAPLAPESLVPESRAADIVRPVADEPSPTGWRALLAGRGLLVAGGILAIVLALAWVAARLLGVGGTGG